MCNCHYYPVVSFLSYYPLKQGLKHDLLRNIYYQVVIFILLSIKTRIETGIPGKRRAKY